MPPADPRIVVTGVAPPTPPPDGPQEPYALIVDNFSGYRSPDEPPPAWTATPISAANYEQRLREMLPRLVASVPDRLTGNADNTLSLDVVLDRKTGDWVQTLLERVPELNKMMRLLRCLEEMKRTLGQQSEARRKFEILLREIAAEKAASVPQLEAKPNGRKK